MKQIIYITILFFFSINMQAQTLMTPFGGAVSNNEYYIGFTTGELVITTTSNTSNHATQGFQQPELKLQEEIEISVINGIIHGDNRNNRFIINEIEQYPNNKILILNRWGDTVYETENYQNKWQGTYNGKPLPEATYYYIFYPDMEKSETVQGNVYILD